MKKVLLVFGILVVAAVALLMLRGGQGGGGVDLSGTGARELSARTTDFLEDLQFKDFEKASSYHSAEDRKKVNIPKLIERLFLVKPEFLDIMRYEVVKVDIDRSGNRARVKTHTVVKILNTGEIREPDVILYWYKDPSEGWVMELESSLHH